MTISNLVADCGAKRGLLFFIAGVGEFSRGHHAAQNSSQMPNNRQRIWIPAGWADRLIYLNARFETRASLHSEGSDASS
jgi:hypothetical protein